MYAAGGRGGVGAGDPADEQQKAGAGLGHAWASNKFSATPPGREKGKEGGRVDDGTDSSSIVRPIRKARLMIQKTRVKFLDSKHLGYVVPFKSAQGSAKNLR